MRFYYIYYYEVPEAIRISILKEAEGEVEELVPSGLTGMRFEKKRPRNLMIVRTSRDFSTFEELLIDLVGRNEITEETKAALVENAV